MRKSNEALYLRLADENLRNFHIGAREYDGFARIAWAVVYFSTKRYFLRTLIRRSDTRHHASCYYLSLDGVRESMD